MPALEITSLLKGSFGEQVTKLQMILRELGFYTGGIDGQFGKLTESAVKKYQKAKNITDNGIVDDNTWLNLFDYRTFELEESVVGRWNNFNTKEIVNPLFDHCPVRLWNELPYKIQNNLIPTMDLVQSARTFIGEPMRINSSWRPNSNGSAHQTGKAIDVQFLNSPDEDYLKIMNWLKDECPLTGFRAVLEWNCRRPWLHIDRGFDDDGGKVLAVMYPFNGVRGAKMQWQPYEGKLPQDYV